MKPFYSLVGLALLAVASAQQGNYLEDDYDLPLPPRPAYRPPTRPAAAPVTPAAPRPTPVPILKQINRHNEDGSYTYGYEGADGSFKIETKLTTGEVMGKYGYVDDTGKVRVVEYGANKYGFMPAGEGITVAPPTLVDETTAEQEEERRPRPQQQSRLYLEDDRVSYYDEAPRPAPRPAPKPVFAPEPVPRSSYKPAAPAYRPPPPAQPAYRPPPQSAPVPSRAQIGGASPAPVPPRPQIPGAAPAPFPAPVVTRPRPAAPVYEEPRPKAYRAPPPQPAPQPARANYARSGPSILDQLERDYALPSGSQSYHDVSFSSF